MDPLLDRKHCTVASAQPVLNTVLLASIAFIFKILSKLEIQFFFVLSPQDILNHKLQNIAFHIDIKLPSLH